MRYVAAADIYDHMMNAVALNVGNWKKSLDELRSAEGDEYEVAAQMLARPWPIGSQISALRAVRPWPPAAGSRSTDLPGLPQHPGARNGRCPAEQADRSERQLTARPPWPLH